MANKSATLIGTVVFDNGNRNTIHVGLNHNTGETIVWQQQEGKRSSRITGRNIEPFLSEIDHVLCEGEAHWDGEVNRAALEALCSQVGYDVIGTAG